MNQNQYYNPKMPAFHCKKREDNSVMTGLSGCCRLLERQVVSDLVWQCSCSLTARVCNSLFLSVTGCLGSGIRRSGWYRYNVLDTTR